MTKYINREELKEMLRREWTKYVPTELDPSIAYVLAKIDELPSIDIRVGKWTEYIDDQHGGLMGRCSACGKSTLYAVSYDILGNRHEMRYCPKCGAKMDGEEQEHE